MKWRGLVVLWAAAACGESVIVATERVTEAELPGECNGESTAAEPAPAVLELLIDTSGTMDDPPPNGRSSKWELTREALLDAIDDMPEQTSLGVVFFPDISGNSPICIDRDPEVSIDRLGPAGSEQRERITEAFLAQSPEGGAPTHDAYQVAFEELAMSNARGRRSILLITDDYPTYESGCQPANEVDVDPLVRATGFAQLGGVSTYVVGLPGNIMEREAREALSRIASAGGTAPAACQHDGDPRFCHFDMSDEQQFPRGIERTLQTITGSALSCSYTLPAAAAGAPPDPEELEVSLSPEDGPRETLARRSAGPCDEGWQYSPDGGRVVLCESTCARVREDKGRIEFRTGCPAAQP